MDTYLWPDTPRATRAQILDRVRLVADLDEVTAPESPPGALLIVGRPRAPGRNSDDEPRPDLVRVSDRLAEMIANRGSIYRTRATEVCALIDIGPKRFARLLEAVEEHLRSEGAATVLSVGFVMLPRAEARDAVAALTLADSRLNGTAAPQLMAAPHGSI